MDHRIALKQNTTLCLRNDRGEAIHCVIESEIGRGGSCIVYEASRVTNTGDKTLYRVKEFYPYRLNISRNGNNCLTPSAEDAEAFNQGREQFRSDFSRTSQLFYSDTNYSSMTNQLDVFRQNGTYYILSAYSSNQTLATYKPETLKECVMLVKQVAHVLGNIHKQGYLYLDTKPQNVLVVDGYQKQVQLFDFDSLLSVHELKKPSELGCSDIRLSYSKGFAPIELRTLKIKRLGPHTDVYGVGALLFYLLFGYTPTAPDCETDSEFDFSKIQYDFQKCDDKLFSSLSDFFHHALAVYYADRYQSMREVVEQLQIIEKYADLLMPRIYSTRIVKPKIFYGREREFEDLDKLLANAEYNCIFVTGMGGIGKSTFIREYLALRKGMFDTILYVNYKGSIEATISNDSNIEINTLRQDEQAKAGTKYFYKKLQKIRELVRGITSVLVIDNFTGEIDDDLRALLSTELKVILLSRKVPSYRTCHIMKLSAVSDKSALLRIFEDNLGRPIADQEQDSFEQILKRIGGHTLVLELIAKQIANSHITISSALSLMNEYGFSAIAPEKVDYEKDFELTNDTIGNIIDALFEASALSIEKKALMKVASLIGDNGIDINQFQKIMKLGSKDDLNQLIQDGWLMISGDVISMHRVIQEAVHRWDWTPEYINAAEQLLTYFYVEIRLESTKNNYPKKLRHQIMAGSAELPPELRNKWIFRKLNACSRRWREKQYDKHGLAGAVYRERSARIKDEAPADIKKLTWLLSQAENIITQCQREKVIYDTDLYINLQITVLLNMPRYREDFIFSETSRILAENAKTIDFGDYTNAKRDIRQDAIGIMQIYELVFSIHAAHGDTKAMKSLLDTAGKAAKYFRKREAYAIYYNMVSDYYDILLDGAYDADNPDEVLLLDKMLDAIEKTLHYSKRGISYDGNHLYAKNILAKATVLMRGRRGTEKEIGALIETAKKIITENTMQFAYVRLQYNLVCAWYFALERDDTVSTDVFVKEARELSDIIIPTDLQKIEEVITPCANIYFELNCYDKAMALLYEGTRICTKHANMDSYAHIRQELCDHLWEVGIKAHQFEWCQKTIERIEAENEEIVDLKNRVVIPDEVRNIITNR